MEHLPRVIVGLVVGYGRECPQFAQVLRMIEWPGYDEWVKINEDYVHRRYMMRVKRLGEAGECCRAVMLDVLLDRLHTRAGKVYAPPRAHPNSWRARYWS